MICNWILKGVRHLSCRVIALFTCFHSWSHIGNNFSVEANNAHRGIERRYRIRHKHQFQLDRKDEKKKQTKPTRNQYPLCFQIAMFDAHFVMMVCSGVVGFGCCGLTNCSYFSSARWFLFHFDSRTLFPFRLLLVGTL